MIEESERSDASIYKSNSPQRKKKAIKPLYCQRFTGVLKATHENGRDLLISVSRCKSWHCEFCSEQNRKQWRACLYSHIEKSQEGWSWFTLTAHENSHKSEKIEVGTLRNITRAWDRLSKRGKRKYGKYQYCRVYERHKTGAYHLHCIRSGHFDDITVRNEGKGNEYTDSLWLRKNARSLGMGYMTHAGNIPRGDTAVIGYVTKYMTKLENANNDAWQRVRRIQTSRGIKRVTVETELDWMLSSGLYKNELDKAVDGNYKIINVTERRLMSYDDFEESVVYPP